MGVSRETRSASIIGHFGFGQNLLDGQTIKTKIVTEELQKQLGQEQVLKIDTHGGMKTLLRAPFQVISALKSSKNVLMFPAQNGLRVYAPLLSFFRTFFRGRSLHYVVIGGWLPQFLQTRKRLARALKGFDGIYVETSTMKTALEAQGFRNIFLMPNCKPLAVLSEDELVYPTGTPYRLCTFSRVCKEKGIEDAVHAVASVNETLGYTAYTLDIYGQVDGGQTEWFEQLMKPAPHEVQYKGSVAYDQSVAVIKNYFALLFPTQYYTEGIPGTIIDAYAAGVPVISSKWESFSDVIQEGTTGVGYSFRAFDELVEVLIRLADHPEIMIEKKIPCLRLAQEYTPSAAMKILIERIRDVENER